MSRWPFLNLPTAEEILAAAQANTASYAAQLNAQARVAGRIPDPDRGADMPEIPDGQARIIRNLTLQHLQAQAGDGADDGIPKLAAIEALAAMDDLEKLREWVKLHEGFVAIAADISIELQRATPDGGAFSDAALKLSRGLDILRRGYNREGIPFPGPLTPIPPEFAG